MWKSDVDMRELHDVPNENTSILTDLASVQLFTTYCHLSNYNVQQSDVKGQSVIGEETRVTSVVSKIGPASRYPKGAAEAGRETSAARWFRGQPRV